VQINATLAMLIALVCVPNVYAGDYFLTGNQLFAQLTGDPASQIKARDYITGAADAIEDSPSKNYRFCVPARATRSQLADVVRIWLEKNPGARHYAAVTAIQLAFRDTFPCTP
jgi:hypothetical protein